ncbi:glycosyltransferase family 61 protein [Candidatus Dependentiae bacterium]|nr:glycosyltransferase family 61 protein [Candidatus Dependentiae bacterium]
MRLLWVLMAMFFFNVSLVHSRCIYPKTITQFKDAYPDVKVIECTKNYPFFYNEFPLYPQHKENYFPNNGYHADLSILEVPNATVSIHPYGYVFVNDCFIKETQVKALEPFKDKSCIQEPDLHGVLYIEGRVAVLNHLYSWIYGLFVPEILTALALLEIYGVQYDYLWIPCELSYQKQALAIWGINPDKLIHLFHGQSLQADTIILPTSISQNQGKIVCNVNYIPDFLLKYVRQKMLDGVAKMNIQMNFPEKIFISRKDASHARKVPNEDEIFSLFEPFGYKQLEFSKFNMAEKIAISHHAKSIITFMGSGSTNLIYAAPDVKIYEIQQEHVEASYFYMAQTLGLSFEILNATTEHDLFYSPPFASGRVLPIALVKEFIENHPDL